MCLMSELKTNRSRGPVLGPMVSMTCLVKLGSNLEEPLVAIIATSQRISLVDGKMEGNLGDLRK